MATAKGARDERFLDELAALLTLEQAAGRARHEGLKVGRSLIEQAALGLVLLDVEAVDEQWGLGGRLLVSLARPDGGPIDGPVSIGAPVSLRPRRSASEESVRGMVARRRRDRVTIAFERPPPAFVMEGRLVVELLPDDATLSRARTALARIADVSHKGAVGARARRRLDVLLAREPPRFVTERVVERAPRGDGAAEERHHAGLNPEQRDAVARAAGAEDLFIVHGPPGTGKSRVLVEIVLQAAARGERVLAAAPSNAAVDHLLDLLIDAGLSAVRLGHPARVSDRLVEHTLDLRVEAHDDDRLARELYDEAHELFGYARRQRQRGRAAQRFQNARDAKVEGARLLAEARRLERRAERAVLDAAQVVCATCAHLASDRVEGEHFDLAIVDEATQAIEPIVLWAFLRAPRVVLAGDHRQLPPTVLSREAEARGLGRSLFERLLQDHGAGVGVQLREQYRMHKAIMDFPSREQYAGTLRAAPEAAERDLAALLRSRSATSDFAVIDAPPLLFLDTAGRGFDEERDATTGSVRNEGEADVLVARTRALLRAGLAPSEIAVIAPYSAQATLLRERLAALGEDGFGVEVDTVDAFQGREREAVLLGLVRSSAEGGIGFLADLRRINVALTRARRHLFIVGDSATVARHPFYERLVEHAQATGSYRTIWDWPELDAGA